MDIISHHLPEPLREFEERGREGVVYSTRVCEVGSVREFGLDFDLGSVEMPSS